MLSGIFVGVMVGSALTVGMSFVHLKKYILFPSAAISGVTAGFAYWCAARFMRPVLFFFVCFALFLLTVIFACLSDHRHFSGGILAFFLSFAAFASFVPALNLFNSGEWIPNIAFSVCYLIVFNSVFAVLFKWFPDADIKECFSEKEPGAGPFHFRFRHIHIIAIFLCVANSSLFLFDFTTVWQNAWATLMGFALFWGGILFMILMISCEKVHTTMRLEQQYRSETQTFLSVIRSQRHDYNFHVQTIAGLIAGNKIDECRAYVHALERDSAEMNVLMPIKDPAISSLIFSFRTNAVRNGIILHIDIEYNLSQIATNVYETNKVLSNLLQNAIDEVSAHKDKSYGIWLTILKRGEFCVIRVSNKVSPVPSAEELGRLYEQGYTTKQGHDGVGLSSIRALAAKYNGLVYTQTEGDIMHFIAKIPINTAKREEY